MFAAPAFLLVIALAYATVTDLKCRRIPNRLTFPMLLGGLGLRATAEGYDGLILGLMGAGIGLATMIAPFALSWVGAGDVKLAMVVGALMGPQFAFTALVFAALVAGGMAVAGILQRRQLVATVRYLALAWYLPAPRQSALKGRLPYAPAMACGCGVALILALVAI